MEMRDNKGKKSSFPQSKDGLGNLLSLRFNSRNKILLLKWRKEILSSLIFSVLNVVMKLLDAPRFFFFKLTTFHQKEDWGLQFLRYVL